MLRLPFGTANTLLTKVELQTAETRDLLEVVGRMLREQAKVESNILRMLERHQLGVDQAAGVLKSELKEVLAEHLRVMALRTELEFSDLGAMDTFKLGLDHIRDKAVAQNTKQLEGLVRKIDSLKSELKRVEDQAYLVYLVDGMSKRLKERKDVCKVTFGQVQT